MLSTKMPKPFSEPPSKVKGRGASWEGFVNVNSLRLALAAHAMFNSLKCPPIFYKNSRRVASSPGQAEEEKLDTLFITAHKYYLSFQIIFKFLQKSSHFRISLKVIEVIIHPQ